LFLLATHYWEGAWLIEGQDLSSSYYRNGREKYWQTQAMLTPCFVTTLHSGPAFFQFTGLSREFEILTDFIDLLIIDEAGQVMPAIAGAMISIAKKALLVGDTKQIEPIFKIPESIDFANAKKFGLCHNAEDYERLKEVGILCSGDFRTSHAYSNVVTRGQVIAKYFLNNEKLPGLMLKEHRRCAKEIISFSNELCYENKLIPMTEEKPSSFPKMGYAHIKGSIEKKGGSRRNRLEAEVIAEWINRNAHKMLSMCNTKILDECVAVITPFSLQSKAIQAALDTYDINIKVGTVHSLQGSEKPIIIFSPVYNAEHNEGAFFFDQSPNMLNVVVSRALRSFLVFGDMDIFDQQISNRPSSLLAKYLFAEQNQILDVIQTKFNRVGDNEIEQINSLIDHRRELVNSFSQANKNLRIVSPFLRINAIESDNIPELIAKHCQRISIHIFTDPLLNKNNFGEFKQAIPLLQNAGAKVFTVNNVHSKVIAIDNRFIIEGSFNWLSASRFREHYKNEECSVIYGGKHVSGFIREALNPIINKAKLDELLIL
jgi:hypothetical protein